MYNHDKLIILKELIRLKASPATMMTSRSVLKIKIQNISSDA